MKGYGWRLVALIWIITGGAIIAGVVIIAGFLYGLVDLIRRVLGGSNRSLPLFLGFSKAITWWAEQLRYAILGAGPGFDPAPDLGELLDY